MLQYVHPNGQVYPNLNASEAMMLYRDNDWTGVIEAQPKEEPDAFAPSSDVIEAEPTALVTTEVAESFGLTNNPAVEVITPSVQVVGVEASPLAGGQTEEIDFEEMRGRKFTSSRKEFTCKSLEEILANLEDLKEREQPQDFTRNLKSFLVQFDKSQPSGQFMFRDGMGEPIKLNRKAYRDLCHNLSGSGSIRYLDRLVRVSNGDKLAALNLNAFRQEVDSLHLFRSALDKNGVRRHNAILSDTYSTYDNVDYVKDVLMCLGDDTKDWHVVRYNCKDGRLHVQLVHIEDIYLNKEVGVPVPAFTLKNGQYGDGSSSISGSTYKLDCANGMYSVRPNWTKRWNHTGDSSFRIKRDMPGVMEDIIIAANGMIELDQQALNIEINDAFAMYEREIGNLHSKTFKEHVEWTMLNEPTVRGNGRLLTSIPDTLTFLAHQQADLGRQAELELLAGQLLHRGIQQAENNRIHIPVG